MSGPQELHDVAPEYPMSIVTCELPGLPKGNDIFVVASRFHFAVFVGVKGLEESVGGGDTAFYEACVGISKVVADCFQDFAREHKEYSEEMGFALPLPDPEEGGDEFEFSVLLLSGMIPEGSEESADKRTLDLDGTYLFVRPIGVDIDDFFFPRGVTRTLQ